MFKTDPRPYQLQELREHGHDAYRGLFWEQGVGKTKPIIDTVAELFTEGEIDGLMVLAPNGVHQNWVNEEIPKHLVDDVFRKTRCHIHFSTDTKKHRSSFEGTLAHEGLAVLVMSYDAVRTDRGQKAWKRFLTDRRCLYVLDESQRIKTPGAKQSKRILGSASAKAAPFRRCLSGTPIDNSPFDLYNQLRFLKPDIWRDLGISSFAAFKSYFGIWETFTNSQTGRGFQNCVAYRNLEKLNEKLLEVGSRLTKAEVLPDLPPKIFSKRYVELSPEQRRLYQNLRDDYMIELAEGDITAPLAIVRLLRFQQIVCGYLPISDDDPTLVPIGDSNPRLSLLAETCEDIGHKCIIWARFTRDIELITQHKTFRGRCVRVDGSVTGPPRAKALAAFQEGDVQFLIANPAAIGTGVTLHSAQTVIYYSNSFKLSDRLQSEDRAHRFGLKHAVHYIDLVARGTVDVRIIESLRTKVNVASQITGDTLAEWI